MNSFKTFISPISLHSMKSEAAETGKLIKAMHARRPAGLPNVKHSPWGDRVRWAVLPRFSEHKKSERNWRFRFGSYLFTHQKLLINTKYERHVKKNMSPENERHPRLELRHSNHKRRTTRNEPESFDNGALLPYNLISVEIYLSVNKVEKWDEILLNLRQRNEIRLVK